MAAHKRTTSESSVVFVPHALSFAGTGEEEDKYYAAQRYDWDNVPPKLTEPRASYELTQPFDYVVPKRKKGPALGTNNSNANGDQAEVIVKKKIGRPRKDAALASAVAEENTPAHSVEPEVVRSLPKKRGRPRRSEASRKTDDGDNTADESYVQPGETWKAGTKRRGTAPQNQPAKRPRVANTAETDDERDTAPLRSGGARSRATPLKPQQANRWSNIEDRQLIDSLFEVLGSIPWRRVTAYMAERGYSCADRGEGAIRGRWKVLRPRLYIVPPPVVRGAAAKSQMKAREREAAGREEGDGGAEEEGDADAEGEEAPEGMDVDPKEPEQPQPSKGHGPDVTMDVEGDTTVEEDEVPPSAPQPASHVEGNQQKSTPIAPTSTLPVEQQPSAASVPPSSRDGHLSGPQQGAREKNVPPLLNRPTSHNAGQNYLPLNQPHTSPNPLPFALLPGQVSHPLPTNPIYTPTDRPMPQTPNQRHESLQTQTQTQPLHSSSNSVHRSPQARDLKDSHFYTNPASATSRLSDHPAFQSSPPYVPPTHSPTGLSPIRHPSSPDQQSLPPLSSQLLSPSQPPGLRLPVHGYPGHISEERHLGPTQEGRHVSSQDSRHLTHPLPLPQPQQFSPAPVWPARVERFYEDNPFDDREKGHESVGERSFHTSGERGYRTSLERGYQASAERERGHHTSPGREFQTSSERGDRYPFESGRERERSKGRDSDRPAKGRKPEMLPFPVTHPSRSRETSGPGPYTPYHTTTPASYQASYQASPYQTQGSPYQGQAAQVFSPPPLYVPPQPLFTTQELVPGGSRLPVLDERTPPGPVKDTSTRRPRGGKGRGGSSRKVVDEGQKRAVGGSHTPSSRKSREIEIVTNNVYDGRSSSQGSALSEVPDSTAGSSDL